MHSQLIIISENSADVDGVCPDRIEFNMEIREPKRRVEIDC
jgi:hypothetical protein